MIKNEIKRFTLSAEGYSDMTCTAPVTLYSALLDNGYIEDPFYSDNLEKVISKVPRKCSLSAEVDLSGISSVNGHVYIRVSGILAKAEMFFNGRSYGISDSPDRIHFLDVTDRISPDRNEFRIDCLEPLGEKIMIENDGSECGDYFFSPELFDMGLIGSCDVEFTNSSIISDVKIHQSFNEDGSVELSVSAELLPMRDYKVVATAVSPIGKMYYGVFDGSSCKITVTSPELWWPLGVGTPSLYKLSVSVYEGTDSVDTYECRVGLRRSVVNGGADGGLRLSVGGVPVFPMGASYVFSPSVASRITKGSIDRMLRSAVSMGMNSLRVLNVGVCPPEFFYDLCDKYGILVFQDIGVPYTSSLATSRNSGAVVDGVVDVLNLIDKHPCAIFAGFSLLYEKGADRPQRASDTDDFYAALMTLVKSKINTRELNVQLFDDLSLIKKCDERFANGAKLSLCALPREQSLESFLSKDDMNLTSFAFEQHSMSDEVTSSMLSEMASVSRFPNGIPQLVYATNLATSRIFSERVRLARAGVIEGISSALCRQLNDGWPSLSASFIDWYGSKKGLADAAKRAYAASSVLVSCEGLTSRFYVINGKASTFEGRLVISLYAPGGKCLFESARGVFAEAMSSVEVCSEDFSSYVKGYSVSELYIVYALFAPSGVVFSGTKTFVPPKSFKHVSPGIELSLEGSGGEYVLKLTSSEYATGVRLSFSEVLASCAENYFDLAPSSPVMIKVKCEDSISKERLLADLRVTSLFDIGK